jgi:uncharacterized protein YpiB (UPF0302 family)
MNRTIQLPFTNEMKGGSKKSFKVLSEKQVNKKSLTFFNYIKKIIDTNQLNNNSNQNQNKQIQFTKASDTKEYYQKIKKNKE